MNAIALLKQDHERVKGLFRDFEAAGDRAHKKKGAIAQEAINELEVHATIEEEIFYPAFQKKGKRDDREMVAEAVEEHHVGKVLMEELHDMDPGDERFAAKFTVLTELIEHHIEEEEGEMFPEAEQRLGKNLDALGEQMARRKEELMSQANGATAAAGGAGRGNDRK